MQQAEFEAVTLRVQMARFDASAARSVVSLLNGQARAITIAAPVEGQILHLYEEHQRVVPPGTILADVGDPRDLEVVVPLLTADAMRVTVGADVRMMLATGTDTLRGRVTRIEPAAFTKVSALGVDEQRVNIVVSAPTRAAHLGDRYRVEAAVTVWESARVLRVPTAALVRDADQWSVFVIQSGRAVRRVVRIGERNDEFAQLLSGLTDADRVVLYPGDQITPGVRVVAR